MTQEVSYSHTETEWSKDLSLKDNFPMPGRRQLRFALAVAVLAIVTAIVLGYYLFNIAGNSKENPQQQEHTNQHQ